MAKDYTKYNVKGLEENLNKRKLVFSIVKDWIQKNNPTFEELQMAFPDEVQGGKGFIRKEKEVSDPKRFNMREPLKIKNGAHIVVSNQWGDNIHNFINCADKLDYQITAIPFGQNVGTKVNSVIDVTDFSVRKVARLFTSHEGNDEILDQIDKEIESLLDQNNKFYIYGRIFEKYGYDYFRSEVIEYFTIEKDPHELLFTLKQNSLLGIIIEKENFKNERIDSDNTDFVIKFCAYFFIALETLIQLDDKEMLAEFIINQSISTIEDDYNVDTDTGDWIGDVTLELIEAVLGYDLQDYEGECEIDGYNFGQANTMGYDYHSYAQDIIDSII